MGINNRFNVDTPIPPGASLVVPTIISQSNEASYTGDAETIDVTGSKIVVPRGYFAPGTTFRFTLGGSRTGTAGAATALIDINGTTAITIAIPSNTAVDWMAEFIVSAHTDFAHQNCLGRVFVNSASTYVAVDYAAATVNVSQESTIKARLTLANGSDEVTCNYCLVEYWKV